MYKSVSKKWNEQIYKSTISKINIYIDDVLLDQKYLTNFNKGGDIFDNELELGSTPSQYIEMQIHKNSKITRASKIRIEYGALINYALTVEEVNKMTVEELNKVLVQGLTTDDSSFEMIPIGIYNVDDYDDEDDNVINIKALDNMIKLDSDDGYYDASELINKKGYATLGEILQDICNTKGVECGSTSFLNSDKQVSVYDNQVTAREYVSYIAECAGGFACAGRDGKLYIKNFYEDTEEIPLKLFKTFKFGEEYKISKVAYEDGIRSFKFGDETRNTLWIRQENMFIIDEDEIQKIYNKVKDLTINSFKGTVIINPTLDIGDKIITDGKAIVFQGNMSLNGRFVADIKSKISIKQKQETTVKRESQTIINRKVRSDINQIDGKITQLVEETSENSTKISEHTQTIEGMKDTITEIKKLAITSVSVEYALSDSPTTEPTGNWSTTAPEWQEGKYMWQRTVTTYEDKTVVTGKAVCISGATGQQGIPGTDGKDGINGKDGTNGINGKDGKDGINGKDGISNYVHIKYSSVANPTDAQMTEIPDEYIGICVNTTVEDPTTASSYIWSKFEGKDGTNGINGKNGIDGSSAYVHFAYSTSADGKNNFSKTNFIGATYIGVLTDNVEEDSSDYTKYAWSLIKGDKGIGINKVETQYYLSTSKETQTGGSWKTTQDTWKEGTYYWIRTKITYDNNNVEYTTPILNEDTNSLREAVTEVKKTADGLETEVKKKLGITELGTKIEQNWEHVKVAWNQISEFIQMEILNGNASLAFRKDASNLLMALDKLGQHFYDNNKAIMSVGVYDDCYYPAYGTNNKTLMFLLNSDITNAYMAWGYKTVEENPITGEKTESIVPALWLGGTEGLELNTYADLNMHNANIKNANNIITTSTIDRMNFGLTEAMVLTLATKEGNVAGFTPDSSDKRLKKNIKNTEIKALDLISKIKHRQFDWKTNNKHSSIGYVAQEMKKINNDFVESVDKDKSLYIINTLSVLATATKAIQEQQEQIEELKEKDKQKDEIIQDLIKRIEALEKGDKNE